MKFTPGLDTPPDAVTTTLPLVAPAGTATAMPVLLHCNRLTGVPLKVTLPLPWMVPKLLPAMVTDEPTAPVLGVSEVILGAATTT